jgi:hypothetical protein
MFFFQANSYLTNEQMQEYIPSLLKAWNNYSSTLNPPSFVNRIAIRGQQYRFIDYDITSRVFYQVTSNSSFEANAFNYRARVENYLQLPNYLPDLLSKRPNAIVNILNKKSMRLNKRIFSFEVSMNDLLSVAVQNEVTWKERSNLEAALQKFWSKGF